MNKNDQYSHEEVALLNKVLRGSLKQNIFHLLNGTASKLKIIDNWAEERKDLLAGIIIEIYNKDDKLILQTIQN